MVLPEHCQQERLDTGHPCPRRPVPEPSATHRYPLPLMTHRPTSSSIPWSKSAISGYLPLLLATLSSGPLQAEDNPPLLPAALSGMRPTALSQSFSELRGIWSPTPLAPILQLSLDGAWQPLRVRDANRNYVPWVDGMVDAQLSAGIGFSKSLRFSAELPFRLALVPAAQWPAQSPDAVSLPNPPVGQGLGDALLELQYEVRSASGSTGPGLTILPALQLPTGETAALAGEGAVQGLLSIALFDTLETGPLTGAILAANVGMRWRSTPVWIPDGSLIHQLEYRVGISLPGSPFAGQKPGVSRETGDSAPRPSTQSPLLSYQPSLAPSSPDPGLRERSSPDRPAPERRTQELARLEPSNLPHSSSGAAAPESSTREGQKLAGQNLRLWSLERWTLERWNLELMGSLPVSPYTSPLPPPLSMLLSARVKGGPVWTLLPALSLGLQPGYGVAVADLGLGLQYWKDPASDLDQDGLIDRLDGCPTQAEDLDSFRDADGCPDPDNDQDGNPDLTDRCPDQAEDPDRFADEDGCPDVDNDRDGVPDTADQCPLSAEDRDGWQDSDGCVDPDNDGDGVLEPLDGCPDAREDRDGFQDDDGCPELDNDGDGISDLLDQCPDAPETAPAAVGVVPDGCPEPEPSQESGSPALTPGSTLTLSGPLLFEKNSTRLTPGSIPVLEEVRHLLETHPQLRLRIEAHTDDKGSAAHNRALSQRRAEALKTTLTQEGIPADHLEAVGMGEAVPLQPELPEEARLANRRIVWIVLPPAGTTAPRP